MCTVCRHNQTKDIDRALLTGATLSSLSRKYGFSTQALQRHQEHLSRKMAQAQQRFHDGLHQGLFCKLNIVLELVLSVVRGAKTGEDFKLFLQATRETTRIISLMHKMQVPLEPELIYCLMASPQWDLQDSLLPDAFQALSKTRQTLAVNLFAPCPEPDSEPIPETASTSPLKTQDSKLEAPSQTGALPDQGPKIEHQSTKPITGHQKPATANRPRKKREITREISAKNHPREKK